MHPLVMLGSGFSVRVGIKASLVHRPLPTKSSDPKDGD